MAIENWPETGRIPVYLVGGAVRDRLLGRTPREYDFAFDADEATFLQRNPDARKVGKSVSVFLLRGQEFMPIEGTLEDDMRRRDLTINALAEDRDGNLFGHPDALSDLREGILRPASPTSFRDEPVRVFRLARMACELPSFTVHHLRHLTLTIHGENLTDRWRTATQILLQIKNRSQVHLKAVS